MPGSSRESKRAGRSRSSCSTRSIGRGSYRVRAWHRHFPARIGPSGRDGTGRDAKDVAGGGDDGTPQLHGPEQICVNQHQQASGGGGIRTHGRLAPTPVFETGPFNHSGTPPGVVCLGNSSFPEELRQQGSAGFGKDTFRQADAMVQSRVVRQAVETPAGSRLRIDGPVNKPSDPAQADRPGAHRARLQGRVKRAAVEPPGTQGLSREGQGQSFRMRRRISKRLPEVVRL